MLKVLFPIVLGTTLPIAAISQSTQPPCSPVIGFQAQREAVQRTGVGEPYSLTAVIKVEQKLSDGNTLSGFVSSRQVRDSQGRTRVDEPWMCAMDKDHQPHWEGNITVDDPVSNTYTLWQQTFSLPRKVATVTHVTSLKVSHPPTMQEELRMAQGLSRAPANGTDESKTTIKVQADDLGKREIAGMEASGMRITHTKPVGMLGNSLPIIVVEEKWVSDRYGIVLLDVNDDPLMGRSTYQVTSFTPGEPDASLFQPPADYKIEDRSLTASR